MAGRTGFGSWRIWLWDGSSLIGGDSVFVGREEEACGHFGGRLWIEKWEKYDCVLVELIHAVYRSNWESSRIAL